MALAGTRAIISNKGGTKLSLSQKAAMIASSSFALYAAMGISYYQKLQPISIGSPAQKAPSHLLSDAGARGGQPAITNKYCSATLNNLQYIDFTKNNQNFTAEDVRFVAQLVCAGAGNQPLEGKRDVVINRIHSDDFPDTLREVVFQDYQFSCILDGGFDKAKNNISDTDVQAVLLEIDEETDPDILFFTAYEYGKYGTPAYSIGDHYFCTR
jgi:hypothetical protein